MGPAAQHPEAGTITGSVDPPANGASVVDGTGTLDVVDAVMGVVGLVDAATVVATSIELTVVEVEPHPTTAQPNANSPNDGINDRRALRETRPLLTTTSRPPIAGSASALSMNPQFRANNHQLALELNCGALGDPWSHGL